MAAATASRKTAGEVIYDELTAELAEVCGVVNAANARLVELTERALRARAWIGEWIHSPAQWLSWQCGLSPQHAAVLVEVPGRLDELPVTFEAFRRDELSFDQWTPVARHAPGWADEQACGFAKVLTVTQLARSTRAYPWPDDPLPDDEPGELDEGADGAAPSEGDHTDEPEQAAGHQDDADDDALGSDNDEPEAAATHGDTNERFWLQPGDDGLWRFGGALDGDHSELFNRALNEARDRLFPSADGSDPTTSTSTRPSHGAPTSSTPCPSRARRRGRRTARGWRVPRPCAPPPTP